MIDIVDSSVVVKYLLPPHGKLVPNTVSEALGLGETEKKRNVKIEFDASCICCPKF